MKKDDLHTTLLLLGFDCMESKSCCMKQKNNKLIVVFIQKEEILIHRRNNITKASQKHYIFTKHETDKALLKISELIKATL